MCKLKTLSTDDVCEWLHKRGANRLDVERIRDGRYNGRVLSFLNRKNRVEKEDLKGISGDAVMLLKELVKEPFRPAIAESDTNGVGDDTTQSLSQHTQSHRGLLEALSTEEVCEWLRRNGASQQDSESVKNGRFNGRILSFLERRNCLHRISSLSIEGQTQLKDWIKMVMVNGCVKLFQPQPALVTVMLLFNDQEVSVDVEPAIELEDLLECVRVLDISADTAQLQRYDQTLAQWRTVHTTQDLQLSNGSTYRVHCRQEQMRKESNLVGVHILCEGDELEIDVEPDIELEELVDCVRILGVSELSQLEQLDGESGQWTVVTETADLRVQSGAKYRPLLHEEAPDTSDHLIIHVLRDDEDIQMEVHSDMELEDFLLCVKSRLGVCDIAQLEQYDLTCQQWMVVTEAEDLELSDGAKYRVKSSHKQETSQSSVVTISIMCGNQELELAVNPDLELEDFQDLVRDKLGLQEAGVLEQYDADLQTWMTVSEQEDLELIGGAKYRTKDSSKSEEPSNVVCIYVRSEDRELELRVEPDLELEDLLDVVVSKLGLSDHTQLEQYDEDLMKWVTVTETEDLELHNEAKYRVQVLTCR